MESDRKRVESEVHKNVTAKNMSKRNLDSHVTSVSASNKEGTDNQKRQKTRDEGIKKIYQCKNNNDQNSNFISKQKKEESYCILSHSKATTYKCQQAETKMKARARQMNPLRKRLNVCTLDDDILTID